MTKRASIFEDDLEVDVSAFVPKKRTDDKAPSQEQVRAVAEAANFPSRQPPKSVPKPQPQSEAKREPRIYRTGRNVQFNVKATQETVDDLYAVSEKQGWVLGHTLERAIAALKRELDAKP